ncbi:polyphosphate kinase 1 [Faecalibacter bovis]|uniref:Polyphosphate kinase n=1 Tax=Faecalibacter bovis TaxID=2898187 RepID=A0ABX7XAQ5_9FLAO|nr:polyphosphate kinase 1 [Faecalibacter bovis]QTV04977.1 polyphosphate kinase 1 [Faecalibacter bovis]
MKKYINRDISWLKFNARVLQEAADENVPLLERIRFLGIYSNNLDEFYSVRYSAILRSIQLKDVEKVYSNIVSDQTDEELIEEINTIVTEQREKYDQLYEDLFKKLEDHNIYVIDDKTLPLKYKDFITEYFNDEFIHNVGVFVLNDKIKIPQLRDGSFYLAVKMTIKDEAKYALIIVPTNLFDRFILLPKWGEKFYIMYIEDIIRYHLNDIFRTFHYDSIEAHSIKITRDSELNFDNDLEHSLYEKVIHSLEERKKGDPVRLVYDREIADDTLQYFLEKLGLDDYDSIIPGGKYHNKRDLIGFPSFGIQGLTYNKIKPIVQKRPTKFKSYFQAFTENDEMIFAPYHDYSLLLKFLREAAIDPKVKKIKLTVYRVAKDSQVMHTLINAAMNGKEVTAILELRARFDESNNAMWSKKLQEAGVNVIFGVPGLKVHSKIAYIERLPEEGIAEKFAIISTGNFHAKTAKMYTDYTYITSNPGITKEIDQVFNFFDKNYLIQTYHHLIVSPHGTRNKIIKAIKREIKNQKSGLEAEINMKLNSLADKEIIDLLYKASQKGVKIRLVVRGINCLIPGKIGLSENIECVSVIDKFLEHPRVYWFKNAGEDKVYISSADMMTRNLDYRVEVACPIYDQNIKKIIIDTFNLSFNDNVKARIIDENSSLTYRQDEERFNRSQFSTYEYLQQLNEDINEN